MLVPLAVQSCVGTVQVLGGWSHLSLVRGIQGDSSPGGLLNNLSSCGSACLQSPPPLPPPAKSSLGWWLESTALRLGGIWAPLGKEEVKWLELEVNWDHTDQGGRGRGHSGL